MITKVGAADAAQHVKQQHELARLMREQAWLCIERAAKASPKRFFNKKELRAFVAELRRAAKADLRYAAEAESEALRVARCQHTRARKVKGGHTELLLRFNCPSCGFRWFEPTAAYEHAGPISTLPRSMMS